MTLRVDARPAVTLVSGECRTSAEPTPPTVRRRSSGSGHGPMSTW
jgi:hypothetical protein